MHMCDSVKLKNNETITPHEVYLRKKGLKTQHNNFLSFFKEDRSHLVPFLGYHIKSLIIEKKHQLVQG